jgi:hypothetical protein
VTPFRPRTLTIALRKSRSKVAEIQGLVGEVSARLEAGKSTFDASSDPLHFRPPDVLVQLEIQSGRHAVAQHPFDEALRIDLSV